MSDRLISQERVSRRKAVTYILGARCKDGVVLVSDRKFTTSSGETQYQDKLFADKDFYVVGSSGTLGLFDKFRTEVIHAVIQMRKKKYEIGSHDFIQKVESIAWNLNKKYNKRNNNLMFEVLIGIKTNQGAVLRYVHYDGLEEPVKHYQAIGSGRRYGEPFLKALWNTNLHMKDIAEIGYFIIKQIEELQLDSSVGVHTNKAQIYFIPDDNNPTHQPNFQELNKIANKVESDYKKYGKSLGQIFKFGASS